MMFLLLQSISCLILYLSLVYINQLRLIIYINQLRLIISLKRYYVSYEQRQVFPDCFLLVNQNIFLLFNGINCLQNTDVGLEIISWKCTPSFGQTSLSSAEALRLSLLFVCMYRSFWIVWMANGLRPVWPSKRAKRAEIFAARSHKWVEHQKERYKQKAVTGVKPLRRRVGKHCVNRKTATKL